MKRVFSGIQPTGEIHLGNYLGAIVNYVALGQTYGREAIYCIVDYHALTNPAAYDRELLRQRTFEAALVNMAAGLDPERVILFVQSRVPEHAELGWIFTTQTPVGDLTRMTQYKDKAARLDSVPAGLLMYPVLQAADILIYKADTVPVGDDQAQHLELCREVARRFNLAFGDTFPEPQIYLNPHAPRVPGTDGKAKMSKSVGNTLGVLEDPQAIWEKVRLMPDDPQRIRLADPGDPERSVVFKFLPYVLPAEQVAVLRMEYSQAGIGTLAVKQMFYEALLRFTEPVRQRAQWLRENPEYVWDGLETGARLASQIAQQTMEEVRERIGLLPHPYRGPR